MKNGNPLFSIIVPVYNVEQFLPQCIESISVQTMPDFELILVNDGSTDNSLAICNDYAKNDKRFVVINQENKGVSMARNTGIEKARGEWLTFVDSDDWVDTDYLECFHLDVDDTDLIVQGLEYYDNRNGKFFKQIIVDDCIIEGKDAKQKVTDNNLLGSGYPVAKAFRRSLIEKGVRFNPLISYHEDHIFVLEAIAKADKIRLSNSVAYKYRYFHSANTLSTRHHSWQNLCMASDGMIEALNQLQERFIESGNDYERKIYNFAYSPKISAVFEVFRMSESRDKKRMVINAIINKKEIKTYYKPYSQKDKLVKSVLSCAPFGIQMLFFSLYIHYQHRI